MRGHWKDTLIWILVTALVAGVGVWWTLVAGDKSYSAERQTTMERLDNLEYDSKSVESSLSQIRAIVIETAADVRNLQKQLDRMEKDK